VSVSTTIVCSMNTLPRHIDMASYIKADRVRRIVVVPTVEKRSTTDVDNVPVDTDNLTILSAVSMAVRIT
jgi:peroxiredoxin